MGTKLSTTLSLAAATALAAVTAGCAATGAADNGESAAGDTAQAVYVAHLQPMNTEVTGMHTMGDAELTVRGDTLFARIEVRNAPPGIVHWQHFHGFTTARREAICPTGAADANGDGIVDLIETNPVSGKTMVPFTEEPASMDVAHGTYPTASSEGAYTYRAAIPLDELRAAFDDAFGGDLDLENRVIYIHGVPASADLPASVASLGPIPAQVTLPIACGEIERVE